MQMSSMKNCGFCNNVSVCFVRVSMKKSWVEDYCRHEWMSNHTATASFKIMNNFFDFAGEKNES